MESRVRLLGHSVHQMLVPFVVGLFGVAVVFDAIGILTQRPPFFEVAYWLVGASILGGLVVAPFGALDLSATPPDSRAKRVGSLHGFGNVIVLLLLVGSWGLRRGNPVDPPVVASVLSFVAVALSLVTAWMGGELVSRLGVGVSDRAGPNAQNSLKGPALAAEENGAPASARLPQSAPSTSAGDMSAGLSTAAVPQVSSGVSSGLSSTVAAVLPAAPASAAPTPAASPHYRR